VLGSYRSRFAGCTRRQAVAILIVTIAATGYCAFLGLTRDTNPPKVNPPELQTDPLYNDDILLYRRMIARVHTGQGYYDAANVELRQHGFRPDSIFNWRLPTYAWVLGALPSPFWGQVVLLLLVLTALVLVCMAERRDLGLAGAGFTVVLLYGVFLSCLGSPSTPAPGHELEAAQAAFSQEMWAAVLLTVSIGALGVGLRSVGVAAGLAALFWRELALPYCLIAAGLAWWHGRRKEALAWTVGLLLFAAFLVYHGLEIARRLEGADTAPTDVSFWLQFTGVRFHIIAVRANWWLGGAAAEALGEHVGGFLAVYLCLAVIGLAGWRREPGPLLALATAAYFLAFAVVARPYNVYWGLIYAPFLPFGVVRAPGTIRDLVAAALGKNKS
jgi:hypothetical protein